MAKRPSDIAPELPELQRSDRERYPGPDSATKADERTELGATMEDDEFVDESDVDPDASRGE